MSDAEGVGVPDDPDAIDPLALAEYAPGAAAVLTTGTLVLMDPRRQVAQLAERDGYDVVYLQTMADAPAACAALAATLHG